VHSLVDTANVRICEVVIKKHELNCFWSTLIGISQILLCVVIHLCHCYPEFSDIGAICPQDQETDWPEEGDEEKWFGVERILARDCF